MTILLTTNLYILILSPFSTSPPQPLPSGNDQSALCVCESVSILFTYFVLTFKRSCFISLHVSLHTFILSIRKQLSNP